MSYATTVRRRPWPVNACDLCGVPAATRHDAAEFGIEGQHGSAGRVCGTCREELRQERAVKRWHKLAKLSVRIHNERKCCAASRVFHLTVLNPDFTESDLTPRAALRLLVIETRKRERRVAG